ncbi:MAG: rhamnogalacturonan lyase [Planctomycetes bacterium]|nr:rhamnogalacturonan lyase [Planctomycetota bacterium]
MDAGRLARLSLGLLCLPGAIDGAAPARQMERLGRGIVAVRRADGGVFVSWRLLATDPPGIAFNLYRSAGAGGPVRLNEKPIDGATCFLDRGADPKGPNVYSVRPVTEGREAETAGSFRLPADAPAGVCLSIPLRTRAGYMPNDASVGDLDGDGEYEIVLHQASRGRDNAQAGVTGEPVLEAYDLDGTFQWRIELGRNIREGAHYTQFMVYDLDGDGQAEIACKTADGTIDGKGKAIGDPKADHRNRAGCVLEGPEFLTIFDGRTGEARVTTDYIPARGRVADWGDDNGNRVDRFLACVAYLDGRRPSLIMCRGYYTRAVLAAWDFRDGKLARRWTFDSDDGTPGNERYRGQGNHGLSAGDIDGDGKDEIVYGACAIDDDGRGLYSTGLGHGDALHLSDMDPDRPGLEIFGIHERPRHPNGAALRDARTGRVLWGKASPDVARGVAMDIDPRHRGYECWAAGPGLSGLWNVKGEVISPRKPRSCNFGVWWDGDLLRELLDGNRITKWNWEDGTETMLLVAQDCASNNGSKSTPALCADILGDWREEVIWRTRDGRELRIWTSPIPTEHRLCTLMHDPQYRLSVAWQNVAYNQPTQPGFYLGEGMAARPPALKTSHIKNRPSPTASVEDVASARFPPERGERGGCNQIGDRCDGSRLLDPTGGPPVLPIHPRGDQPTCPDNPIVTGPARGGRPSSRSGPRCP